MECKGHHFNAVSDKHIFQVIQKAVTSNDKGKKENCVLTKHNTMVCKLLCGAVSETTNVSYSHCATFICFCSIKMEVLNGEKWKHKSIFKLWFYFCLKTEIMLWALKVWLMQTMSWYRAWAKQQITRLQITWEDIYVKTLSDVQQKMVKGIPAPPATLPVHLLPPTIQASFTIPGGGAAPGPGLWNIPHAISYTKTTPARLDSIVWNWPNMRCYENPL